MHRLKNVKTDEVMNWTELNWTEPILRLKAQESRRQGCTQKPPGINENGNEGEGFEGENVDYRTETRTRGEERRPEQRDGTAAPRIAEKAPPTREPSELTDTDPNEIPLINQVVTSVTRRQLYFLIFPAQATL